MARHFEASPIGDLWRRAVQALSAAFDPARDADSEDTVFQPRAARARAEPEDRRERPAEIVRPSGETLQ